MKIALSVIKDLDNGSLNCSLMEEKIIEAAYNGADIVFFSKSVFECDLLDIGEYDELVNYCKEYAITIAFGYDGIYKAYDYNAREIFDSQKQNCFNFDGINFYYSDEVKDSFTLLSDNKKVKYGFWINRYDETENGGAYFNNGEEFLIEEKKEEIIYINI